MRSEPDRSRRAFMKGFGAAGAAALTSGPLAANAMAQAPPLMPELPEATLPSLFPTLNRRTRGWLRFLWEKATTEDDWGAHGVPHPWWDRYTAPVVLSYGRFDLSYSTYALLLMADQTPAWREAYTRIADGLASRYPTYWGAIDWLTQIGDDPKRENYPPQVMGGSPSACRASTTGSAGPPTGLSRGGCKPIRSAQTGICFSGRGSTSFCRSTNTSPVTTSTNSRSR